MHCLVGAAHVERLGIGIRIDCDGGDPHLTRGADDAAGDFAAIGDQYFFQHYFTTNSGWSYSTGWPFSTRILTISPATSASIWLSIFIASMMHSVSLAPTV